MLTLHINRVQVHASYDAFAAGGAVVAWGDLEPVFDDDGGDGRDAHSNSSRSKRHPGGVWRTLLLPFLTMDPW